MKERHLNDLLEILNGVELDKEELRFVNWIAGYDDWTVDQVISILKKSVKSEKPKVAVTLVK